MRGLAPAVGDFISCGIGCYLWKRSREKPRYNWKLVGRSGQEESYSREEKDSGWMMVLLLLAIARRAVTKEVE